MGFGNSSPPILNNKGKINKDLAERVMLHYNLSYVDFSVKKDEVVIGIEPAYQGERLFLFSVNRDKGESYIVRGIAFGYYGSGIVGTKKNYKDYKRQCPFVRLIDELHPILFKDKE